MIDRIISISCGTILTNTCRFFLLILTLLRSLLGCRILKVDKKRSIFSLTIMNSYNSPTTKPLYQITRIIWYLSDLLEILLAFRFFLRFAGANPTASFTNFIYSVSWPFVEPFFAVFRATVVQGKVIEWTTLLAMIVYSIITWGITTLILMGKTVSTTEAAAKLDDDAT